MGVDFKLREAERRWLTEQTPDAWTAYLKHACRAGMPLFDAGFIADTLQGQVTGFQYTGNGFLAHVENALHPQIELEFPIGSKDSEYLSLWDRWGGTVRLVWEPDLSRSSPTLNIWEPELPLCPTLDIVVGSYANTNKDFLLYSPGMLTRYLGSTFVYNRDCVTREQFIRAMHCPTQWMQQWPG